VQAVEIDVDIIGRRRVFVAVFVKDARGFAVGFAHQVVFGLAAEGECFGGAGVVSIPGLGGAGTSSQCMLDSKNGRGSGFPHLCKNLFRKPPCLKASCRALRYAWFVFSPVSSQGICCGAGIALAARLCSRLF